MNLKNIYVSIQILIYVKDEILKYFLGINLK